MLDAVWAGQYPVEPVAIAEKVLCVRKHGDATSYYPVTIQPRSGLTMGPASGFATFVGGDAPHFVCAYNRSETPLRHRFVQAYELAHVMMGHVEDTDGAYRRDISLGRSGSIEEIQCLEFVFALLMPENHIRHMTQTVTNIQRLASHYGVAPITVRNRLKSLGIL